MKSQTGARYLGRQKTERDPISLERAVCCDSDIPTRRVGDVKTRKKVDVKRANLVAAYGGANTVLTRFRNKMGVSHA